MLKQNNLLGETLPLPQGKNELNDVCCDACYYAEGDDCDCKCRGAFHGLGRHNNAEKNHGKRKYSLDPSYEYILPPEEAKEYRKFINRSTCNCGGDLTHEPILYYKPHSDGWRVKCESEPVWLFIKCSRCGYDWSLWKLGCPRDFSTVVAGVV